MSRVLLGTLRIIKYVQRTYPIRHENGQLKNVDRAVVKMANSKCLFNQAPIIKKVIYLNRKLFFEINYCRKKKQINVEFHPYMEKLEGKYAVDAMNIPGLKTVMNK